MRSKNSLSENLKINFQDFQSCFLLVKLLEKHGNFQSSGKFMRQWFLNERITYLSLVWITQLRDAWLSLGQMCATFPARYWKNVLIIVALVGPPMLHRATYENWCCMYFDRKQKKILFLNVAMNAACVWPLHATFPATTFPCWACALIRFL